MKKLSISALYAGLLLLCLKSSILVAAEANTPVANTLGGIGVFADMPTTDLASQIKVYVDKAGVLDFPAVSQADSELEQRLEGTGKTNFGFSDSIYWVTFDLHNQSDRRADIFIRQDYPLIDYLDFWVQPEDNAWEHVATGDQRPFETRPIHNREFIFPVSLGAGEATQVIMRYQSQGSVNIGLSVSGVKPYLETLANYQLFYGAYYGGFFVLVIYNLILFLAIKERVYVHYMVYVVSYGLYMAVQNGFAIQYIWPASPWLANQSLPILLGVSVFFGTQFSRLICNIKVHFPTINRITGVLQGIAIILLASTLFLDYRDLVIAWSIHITVVCSLILVFGFMCALRGDVASRYFIVAWTTFLVFVIIYMLKTFGVLPHNSFTQNSFQLGSLLEMILLSLALGTRYRDMQKLGYSDSLSSLGNRREFNEKLPKEFEKVKQHNGVISVLMLDIDHFKSINDNYGHPFGDKVLTRVGKILKSNIRSPNFACRYGGEEFTVILPRTTEAAAEKAAERLRHLIESVVLDDIKVTVSIGVASSEHLDSGNHHALVSAADQALYKAKREGRNRVMTYSSISPDDGELESEILVS